MERRFLPLLYGGGFIDVNGSLQTRAQSFYGLVIRLNNERTA
jgi:hypothetical protein